MIRRIGVAVGSMALITLAVFGSAAGAFAAKSKTATGTVSTAAVAGATTATGARSDRGPGRGPGGPGGGLVEVVAKLTGETTTTVMTARESGKSFTQIASAKDVTAAQIVELALHAPEAALKSEVSDGLITQSEADKRLAALKTHLTEEVAETTVGGHGGRGGHDGPPPTSSSGSTNTSATGTNQ